MPFFHSDVQTTALGIDISSSSIKLAGLKKHQGKYILEAFSKVSLPAGAVVEKDIQNMPEVTQCLKKALSLSRVRQKNACVALADAQVMTKVVEIPNDISELEFEEHVFLQADKFVPYPLEEVAVDYQILNDNTHSQTSKVFVAAVQKEILQKYSQVLEEAGLMPALIDMESFAMRKACNFAVQGFAQSNTTAVIDIGSMSTQLIIYHDGLPAYFRSELFGSEFLIKNITTDAFALTDYEQTLDSKLYEAFKQKALQHIKRALQFYNSSENSRTIEKLVLCGSAALMAGLDLLIGSEIKISLEVADPITKLTIGGKVPITELSHASGALMTAFGLALRGLD